MKLYSGRDKPLDLFVQKLPENVRLMDARFEEIASVFRAEGVEDFMKLPESCGSMPEVREAVLGTQ